jgi:hypothetical protein
VTIFEGGVESAGERRRALALALVAVASLDDREHRTALVGELQALCRALATHLGLDGAAVNLMTRPGDDWVVASADERSMRIGELPFTLGEGPSLEALAHGRPVIVTDLSVTSTTQWAGYASSALELGVGAVFAIPLHVGAVQLGVLEAYAYGPRALEDEELAMLLSFAQVGTEMLLDGQVEMSDGTFDGRLTVALDHRAEVHQAQGMLMVDLGIGLAEALVRMRAHAFSRDLALIDVARAIIAGRVLAEGSES